MSSANYSGNHLISQVIPIDTAARDLTAIARAVEVLSAGGVVAYPTETFYGLAVDTANEAAIQKLFSVKGRPPDRPVLILIYAADLLDTYVARIPPVVYRLMDAFWPGNLTLVFEATSKISPLLTAGMGKIGIRLSSHPVAAALTRTLQAPITGTSANVSDRPACKNTEQILQSMGHGVDLILDAGETPGRIGSTVLDVTVNPLRILREGVITKEEFRDRSFDVV